MSMFDRDDMKLQELNEMLKESMETNNMIKKQLPMRLYLMAKEENKRRKLEQEIINSVYEKHRKYVTNVFIIDDNSAIIERKQALFDQEEKLWYEIHHNGMNYAELADSFDKALIMLVCARKNMLINSDAHRLITKMLDI